MINPNEPAFPTLLYDNQNGQPIGSRLGLSIQAELASRFMAAILVNASEIEQQEELDYEKIAKHSIIAANTLIIELNKLT